MIGTYLELMLFHGMFECGARLLYKWIKNGRRYTYALGHGVFYPKIGLYQYDWCFASAPPVYAFKNNFLGACAA